MSSSHTTTKEGGRLGNQIIRNLAVSLIAEKHDLFVEYSSRYSIERLGIKLFVGKKKHKNCKKLNMDNYFAVLNNDTLTKNLDPNDCYFQNKEITNLIYNHLHSDDIIDNIMNKNQFKERYLSNNDLFIHVRLGDTVQYNPGIQYYLKAISKIKYDNLYISTDDKSHPIISEIAKNYPYQTHLLMYDEVSTLQFASTCKHVILSHGSFSAVIGYLSFFSEVYYPEYEEGKMWYGDMFSIDGWNKVCNYRDNNNSNYSNNNKDSNKSKDYDSKFMVYL